MTQTIFVARVRARAWSLTNLRMSMMIWKSIGFQLVLKNKEASPKERHHIVVKTKCKFYCIVASMQLDLALSRIQTGHLRNTSLQPCPSPNRQLPQSQPALSPPQAGILAHLLRHPALPSPPKKPATIAKSRSFASTLNMSQDLAPGDNSGDDTDFMMMKYGGIFQVEDKEASNIDCPVREVRQSAKNMSL
jgi:hypothetical protein